MSNKLCVSIGNGEVRKLDLDVLGNINSAGSGGASFSDIIDGFVKITSGNAANKTTTLLAKKKSSGYFYVKGGMCYVSRWTNTHTTSPVSTAITYKVPFDTTSYTIKLYPEYYDQDIILYKYGRYTINNGSSYTENQYNSDNQTLKDWGIGKGFLSLVSEDDEKWVCRVVPGSAADGSNDIWVARQPPVGASKAKDSITIVNMADWRKGGFASIHNDCGDGNSFAQYNYWPTSLYDDYSIDANVQGLFTNTNKVKLLKDNIYVIQRIVSNTNTNPYTYKNGYYTTTGSYAEKPPVEGIHNALQTFYETPSLAFGSYLPVGYTVTTISRANFFGNGGSTMGRTFYYRVPWVKIRWEAEGY